MLVATAESESAVMRVMTLAMTTMSSVFGRPTEPTTHPKRRNMITPRMVSTVGV